MDRDAEYKKYLKEFIKEYICLEELEVPGTQAILNRFRDELASLKNNVGYGFLFNDEESRYLLEDFGKNASGVMSVNDVIEGRERSLPALIQLYDYVRTLDELYGRLNMFEASICTGNVPINDIPHVDNREWGFVEVCPERNVLDDDDIDITIGQDFRCNIYDPNMVIFDDKKYSEEMIVSVRRKHNNERAQDEACLYGYTLVNELTAVSQGLFKVYRTKANELDTERLFQVESGTISDVLERYKSLTKKHVPIGRWINAAILGFNVDVLFNADGEFIYQNHFVTNIATLVPKITNLKLYKDNRFERELKRHMISKRRVEERFAYDPTLEPPKRHKTGGAIGCKVVNPGTGLNFFKSSVDDIMASYGALQFHPIFACKNLSIAYNKTLGPYFRYKLERVSRMNSLQFRLDSKTVNGGQFPTKDTKFYNKKTGESVALRDAYIYNEVTGNFHLKCTVRQDGTCQRILIKRDELPGVLNIKRN